MKSIKIENHIEFSNNNPIAFIAGPCVIESRQFALETAQQLKEIFEKNNLKFIYKSSFDKANRSSSKSFRGVGLDEGLSILQEVKSKLGIPVLTDVHESYQVEEVSKVVDMLQTPAFLARQTDFIQEVARAKKPVNIKKGQFMAPSDMAQVLAKCIEVGNDQIALCERGSTFGYNNLVVDMRGLAIMASTMQPVIFDATHSVQLPGAGGSCSLGQRQFVPVLARSAVAAKIAGVFLETHPDPDKAPCDGPNMIDFKALSELLPVLKAIDEIVKKTS